MYSVSFGLEPMGDWPFWVGRWVGGGGVCGSTITILSCVVGWNVERGGEPARDTLRALGHAATSSAARFRRVYRLFPFYVSLSSGCRGQWMVFVAPGGMGDARGKRVGGRSS